MGDFTNCLSAFVLYGALGLGLWVLLTSLLLLTWGCRGAGDFAACGKQSKQIEREE